MSLNWDGIDLNIVDSDIMWDSPPSDCTIMFESDSSDAIIFESGPIVPTPMQPYDRPHKEILTIELRPSTDIPIVEI